MKGLALQFYYNIHDLLKFERLGYRKVDDQLTREIRHGRIASKEAFAISKTYF